jgi:imidazolonepropionase-like amidohydrolase
MSVARASTVTIDAKALWTGRKGQVIHDARIVLGNDTISAVGKRSDFGEPEGTYLDFSNCWVVPGFIDVHAHVVFGEQGRRYEDYIREDSDEIMLLRAARNAQTHMAIGVTTMRDCGGRNNVVMSLRNGITRGYLHGPRILASGRPLTITGGHFWWCNQECDGVEGVRQAARRLIKDGVDFFKLMASGGGTRGTNPRVPSFTAEEIKAATDVARDHGMLSTAHCEATASVERAIKGGIHCVEHAGFQELDGTRIYRPDLVDEMAQRGIYYSPTIQTAYGGLRRYAGQANLSPSERRQYESARYKLVRKLENLEKFYQAGVQVVAGTDSIGTFGEYAICLELFCHACMTPEQALISATSLAAEAIGLGGKVGTIEASKAGDLVFLEENPLENISAVRKIAAVMKGGNLFGGPMEFKRLPGQSREAEDVARIVNTL